MHGFICQPLSPLCPFLSAEWWTVSCGILSVINVTYFGVSVAWKKKKTRPPLVCLRCVKFGRHVIFNVWLLICEKCDASHVFSVMNWYQDYFLFLLSVLFVLFVWKKKKSRFLLLKVTTFIIPVVVHSSFSPSSSGLRMRGVSMFFLHLWSLEQKSWLLLYF